MPSLDNNPFHVKSYQAFNLKTSQQQIMVWDLSLLSTSDTLTVPGLESTTAVGALTAGITVTSAAIAEGNSLLTIAGGSDGARAIIATAHRVGLVNNTSIDEDPT